MSYVSSESASSIQFLVINSAYKYRSGFVAVLFSNLDSSKMKDIGLITMFILLLCALVIGSNGEDFVRVTIQPRSVRYDSAGNVEFSPEVQHDRSIRSPTTCKIPNSLYGSSLDCNLYPNKVKCTQVCMFGHTLREGIKREMNCDYKENIWRPVIEFEDCQPFIDCTLTLGPGGEYTCFSNYMDRGNHCELSCKAYEDKEEVPAGNYTCDIQGNWSPKLPFCARAGSGIKLVSPPKGPRTLKKSSKK